MIKKCALPDIIKIVLTMLQLAIQFPTLSITSVHPNLKKLSKTQREFSLKFSKYTRRLWIIMKSVPCKLQTKGQIFLSNAISMQRTALRLTVMVSSTI